LELQTEGKIGEAFRHDLISHHLIIKRQAFEGIKIIFKTDFDPVTKGPF